jgi:hypothetical protein
MITLIKRRTFALILIATSLTACAGLNTKMTGSWKNDEILKDSNYSSVFIDVMGPNVQVKNMLEDELENIANERGLNTVKSQDVFKKTLFNEGTPSKEELLKAIRETGLETVFIIALKDKETTTRYVPGRTTYYSPMGFGYYGSYYRYYSTVYAMNDGSGYYTQDKSYYVESNLYDVESEELIWSAQSETYNPNSSEDFVRGYTKALIDKMIKDGVLKKVK